LGPGCQAPPAQATTSRLPEICPDPEDSLLVFTNVPWSKHKKKVLVIHKQKNVNQSINQCVLIDVFFQTLILENHQAIFFQTCFFQTLISNHWFLVLMAMGIQTTFHGHRAASQPRLVQPHGAFPGDDTPILGAAEAPSLDAGWGWGIFGEQPPKR
jgi:hypothetical protein